MSSYNVDLVFNDGGGEHILPLLQSISDPQEGMKAVVHEGNRGDGSIVIPGGRKSQEIIVKGILLDNTGYAAIQSLMASFRSDITTLPATLTLKHFDGGWVTDWTYIVRRIGEIKFDEASMRTNDIEYTVTFLVLSY